MVCAARRGAMRSLQRVKTLWHIEQLLQSAFRYLFYICREDVAIAIKRTYRLQKKRGGPAGASCASGQKRAPRGGWARVLCGTDAAALWTPSVIGGTRVTFHVSTAENDEDRWIVDLDASGVRLGKMSLLKYPRFKEASITVLLFPLMIMTVCVWLFILSILLLWNFAYIYNQTLSHPVIC